PPSTHSSSASSAACRVNVSLSVLLGSLCVMVLSLSSLLGCPPGRRTFPARLRKGHRTHGPCLPNKTPFDRNWGQDPNGVRLFYVGRPVDVSSASPMTRTYAGVPDECRKLRRKSRPLMKFRT